MIRAESIPPRLTPWKASQSNCYRRAATRAAQAPPRSGQESWTSLHTALKTIGVPTSFGSLHITAINSAFVTASLPIALGRSGRDRRRSAGDAVSEDRGHARAHYRYRECSGGPPGRGRPSRMKLSIRPTACRRTVFSGRRFEPLPDRVHQYLRVIPVTLAWAFRC